MREGRNFKKRKRRYRNGRLVEIGHLYMCAEGERGKYIVRLMATDKKDKPLPDRGIKIIDQDFPQRYCFLMTNQDGVVDMSFEFKEFVKEKSYHFFLAGTEASEFIVFEPKYQ